jgi:hypothetical protein
VTYPGAEDSDFADGRSTLTGHHDPEVRIALTLARIDAKITTFTTAQAIRDEGFMNDIRFIRESSTTKFTDHESRIRLLEGKRYVESRTVWMAFGAFTAVGSLIIAIIGVATK